MTLKDDLTTEVKRIFHDQWTVREGQVVPAPKDIKLSNDAIHFKRATILYADLNGSTRLVDSKQWWFAAEIYRAFLHCAAQLIRAEGGSITAYDGDRVMGVFLGETQTTPAVRCALKINWAVRNLIQIEKAKAYATDDFVLKHVVGVDTTEIRVARTGVRGDNDLVWIGRAANYAAKLTDLNTEFSTWITQAAFDNLHDTLKINGNPPKPMWQKRLWTSMRNMEIYGSTWTWSVE